MKSWARYYWRLLRAPALRAALRKRFPTCEIYDDVVVDAGSSLGRYVVVFDRTTICGSVLGDHTYVQKNSNLFNCRIGKFCSIAPNVNIGLGRHPVDRVSSHPAFYSVTQPIARSFAQADTFEPFKPVTIGNDVWIGHSALVMDGVSVGNGAVVAANAVVTANVAPYSIVAGVPARTIRLRFDEETVRKLDASAWWDRPEAWLQENCRYFATPQELLRILDGEKSNRRT